MGAEPKKIIVFLGMGGNRHHAEKLLPVIQQLNARLRIISEWPPNPEFPEIEYVKWFLHDWADKVKECDVAIAPQDIEIQPAKSAVKILAYMSCGVPVVASPLQSYKEIIINEHNGYIAHDRQQWLNAINCILNCTPEFKEHIISNAFISIEKFSPDAITDQWAQLLIGLGGGLGATGTKV